MSPSAVLASPATVIRVVTKQAKFLPDGVALPTGEAFAPSSDDKADAAESGKPIRVSVWDHARTTVSQAHGFRQTDKPLMSFFLGVGDVLDVGKSFDEPRLRVVEDPIAAYSGQPGGDGHCGIEGLDTPFGVAGGRKRCKTIRDEIARRVRPTGEGTP